MRSLSFAFLLAIPNFAHSLLVTSSSPQCADLCGNSLGSTSGQEMTCDDLDYQSSTYGATFKQCLACELTSTYYDTAEKQSDLQWGIYNLRYALSWCLFGFDNNTATANTPCLTSFSCGPLQAAFEYDGLNPNSSAYSYCPLMSSKSVSIPKCSSCLAELGNEHYLANFVTALNAACIQQPTPGTPLSLQGTVFSATAVNITQPSASSLSTYNPSTGGLTLSAKIGIAVSGLVLLLACLGFCIVWRGKRRRRRILAEKAARSGYAWQAKHGATRGPDNLGGAPMGDQEMMGAMGAMPGEGGGAFFDSPQSTRPFANAWGHNPSPGGYTESPISPAGAEKAYFSPYQSQWNSPISATDPPRMQEWPQDTKQGLGLSVMDDGRGENIEMVGVGADSKRGVASPVAYLDPDKKDRYFAQVAPVAPTLSHPGHGRSGSLGLTEADAKRGNAL